MFAINKNKKRIKATNYTNKNQEYYCPLCGEKVILKKGNKYKPYFSHRANIDCVYSNYDKNRNNKKNKIINDVRKYFKEYKYVKDIQIESSILDNSITDVVIILKNNINIAVEIVEKDIDINEYISKTNEYNLKGYNVLWLKVGKSSKKEAYLYSLFYINNKINQIVKNESEYKYKELENKDSIYLNKKIIYSELGNVFRLGVGKANGAKDWIFIYDLI